MKQAVILYFSDQGKSTAVSIAEAIQREFSVKTVRPGHGELGSVVDAHFSKSDAVIFVSSCGIAVRAIAPFLVHKTQDPAVIVCDELGKHAISLLSGHIGGANELTGIIAERIGADPIITTATDINHRFSVDAWAAKHGLAMEPYALLKRFSAEILKHDMPMHCDHPIAGELPGGIVLSDSGAFGVSISAYNRSIYDETLMLIPKIVHLGIGCKRDTPADRIRCAIDDALRRLGLHVRSIADISSIDLKKDEPGILETANEMKIPFKTYSASELNELEGEFSVSAFVHGTVGVDCVCERACMYSAGAGAHLIMNKTKYDGVTCAVSIEDWRVSFE